MNDPKYYRVQAGLMDTIYKTLQWYSNRCSYIGERTGGVVAGCPRGPAPTPDELVRYAQQALDRINVEVLKRSKAT